MNKAHRVFVVVENYTKECNIDGVFDDRSLAEARAKELNDPKRNPEFDVWGHAYVVPRSLTKSLNTSEPR